MKKLFVSAVLATAALGAQAAEYQIDLRHIGIVD